MANPDQKTILIDNAFEEIKNICINLQKDTDASNSELKSLLKLIINEWEEKEEQKPQTKQIGGRNGVFQAEIQHLLTSRHGTADSIHANNEFYGLFDQ